MDALTSNIRVFTGTSSLPDKPSLPESASVSVVNANAPSDIVATSGKVENNSLNNKTPSDDDNSKKHTPAEIEGAVKGANYFLEQISRELRFERSESDGKMVVQVKDQKTGTVIRQFPSEEMIQISKDLEKMSGLLFKDSA